MGKEKIEQSFKKVQKNEEKAFVPYIMAGDGGLENLKEQILFLQNSGATMIELGIPFSDPVADGPVIQDAGIRSLKSGTNLRLIFNELEKIQSEITVPLIVMTYINQIYAFGIQTFVERCKSVGVDGVIIPDLPLEQSEVISPFTKANNIALIQLVSMTSSKERQRKLASASEGFLYAVTVTGITGTRTSFHKKLAPFLKELHQVSEVPVLAGFGISSAQQAKEVSESCRGVIVGSKIVQLLHEGKKEEVKRLIEDFHQKRIGVLNLNT
jgi:tryptophan synthase alpha chain